MNVVLFRLLDDSPLAPQVTARLRDAIVRLELLPGEPLSESDIAARFGVSRQPVREAFIKLADMGLVTVRPQRGTFVLQISVRDVMNARFVREAVEVEVVREVARAPDRATLALLRDNLIAQAEAVALQDSVRFLRLDEAFHQALARSIGRVEVWGLLQDMKAQMDRVRFLSFEGATPLAELLTQHSDIVERIGSGDPAGADSAMRRHMREILSSLPLIAAAHPEYFAPDETLSKDLSRTGG